ncbi:hypothetical protein [Paraflavitalea sp. CAU 1676]|uniref:hypothetical protein n=1 Tax=Paraflavitalea sp. CAU 1676 TaxID=3032598 RepID=UPI0023DB9C33|nr:hypothetical protein [Paraflavitalea sp. CAU 1676]MDF2190595.1 hypothetical protein [Paraflavitalea sp. CAU 1676]
MRFKASILFVCLLVYVLELVLIPLMLPAAPAHVHVLEVKRKPACCRSRVTEAPCSKPTQEACCKTNCCLSSPLSHVIPLGGANGGGVECRVVVRIYPYYSSHYFYTYYRVSWKPPDAC